MLIWLNNTAVKKQLEANIKNYKNLYVLNGIIFVVLGLLTFLVPFFAAEVFDVLIGLLLFLTGLFQLGVNYATRRHWSYYLSAIISIIAGILLISQPASGVIAITVVIAIFMLLQGCMQLFYASLYAPFPGWGWMLVSGGLSIALAAIVYAGWPISAAWFLGLLIGVNLVSIGLSMIMLTNIMCNERGVK